jgi:preprotein translocase subunit SecD
VELLLTQKIHRSVRKTSCFDANERARSKRLGRINRQSIHSKVISLLFLNIVYSAPGVSSGPIAGGRSEISGSFDVTETKDLANVLRAGKLPASADIVQSEVVGPSLGQEAIDNGTNSAIVGLLVSLWMMVYYGKRLVC